MADYRAMARRSAQKYGLDPGVFERQINQESGFNPSARSPKGAAGIAQIMPDTARGWGVDPMNPAAALDAAARNMKQYVDRYGSYENALRAYNAGPGKIQESKSYAETNQYVATILGGKSPKVPTPGKGDSKSETGYDVQTTTTPGVDNRVARAQLIESFLSSKGSDPLDFALQARGLRDVAPTSSTVRTPLPGETSSEAEPASSSGAHGTALFEGKKVAAWIAPALTYARQQGWKGTVNSGFRSLADQTRIYNSGVRPAAKPGTSNHEGADFPRGAVDVSDAQTLSRILRASPWARKLVYAGTKDPVHFSHPHGGSY
jgi:hypothetical protein